MSAATGREVSPMLLHDPGRRGPRGFNVKTPISLLGAPAYQLTLYEELGRPQRSVLMIGMTLQFQFKDGDNGLTWSGAEKQTFADKAVAQIKEVWNDKFRITTTSKVPREPFRDVGVMFNLSTYIDGWHADDDFELSVKKIASGGWASSCVQHSLGDASLDSEDVVPANKGGGKMQRGIVHEFGHMLGLNDEYDTDPNFVTKHFANRNWLGDNDSVMHSAEMVRPRHYVPFASWLTGQFAAAAHYTRTEIKYKVEGRWDSSNAAL
jgi:hypothetical protein